jgi:hypothetical protein
MGFNSAPSERVRGERGGGPDRSVKTEERLVAIHGAAIVFGTAFGPSSAARLHARGVRPATAPPGTRIEELLSRLTPRGRA